MLAAGASLATDLQLIDSMINKRWDAADAPGGAIVIARGDSIIYEQYRGMARLDTYTSITEDTRFNIASVSKQFTVMALLQQAAAYRGGMPLLDTPVDSFLCYTQPWWHEITPAMLASHTSGLPDAREGSREWKITADDDDAISYFADLEKPAHGAGEYYDYLNPSFILLARIVEQLSGQEFTAYAEERLFKVSGMGKTSYFDPHAEMPGQAHAYIPDPDGSWREYDYGEETFFATRPDGGIYSTARDMLSWLNALRDGIVLPHAWISLSRQPRVSVSASPYCDYQRRPDTWYALGQFVEHPAGQPIKIFHTGDNGGFQAYVAVYPESDTKIIVLENRNDRSRSELVDIIDRALQLRR
ncbi:MAG: beta-lactamase family protein [Odoribacter sp.]|nr:beta-lactamase family protein [Odoribacter sp.]